MDRQHHKPSDIDVQFMGDIDAQPVGLKLKIYPGI